ncbi:MAG: PAS domain-containing protein, partial [Methanobacterium sp.]
MDSENMSSENTVQKSDDYKEIFFNDHTVMFLIDPVTLKIMDANLAAINFYGYKLEEFVKLKISDINVASDEYVLDKIQKSVSKEKNHFIFKHRLSNGEIRDVEVYSGLIKQNGKDVLYSIIHDITDDELQNTLKRFYTILSSMYGAILLVSDTNLIEFTNQA